MRLGDLDKAEAVLRNIADRLKEDGDEELLWASAYTAADVIKRQPSVDAAPVRHGRWVWDSGDVYICTRCGEKSNVKEVMGNPDWDWCPNCGALMDGGADND